VEPPARRSDRHPDVRRPRDRDATNPAFRLKLILLVAAFLNAGVFHRWPFRTVGDWDTELRAPLAARVIGVLSIALWVGVIACGRLIAYF